MVSCVLWCVCVVWCGTLKNLRVYIQNVPVCTGTTPVHTERGRCVCVWWEEGGGGRGKGEGVLRDTPTPTPTHCTPTIHTMHNEQTHNTQHRTRKVASSVLLTKICPRKVIAWSQRFTKRSTGSYSRIGREQHVPDCSNHSLYLIKLFSFSNLEGSSGGNQQPDGSISLSHSPPHLPPPPQHHKTRNRDRDTETETETQTETQPKCHELFARQTLSMMFS